MAPNGATKSHTHARTPVQNEPNCQWWLVNVSNQDLRWWAKNASAPTRPM
jgi:hypothetical protein